MPIPVRPITLAPFVILGLSGSVLAAENLPPLRVDPALLGERVSRPRTPPAADAPMAEPQAPVPAVEPSKAGPAEPRQPGPESQATPTPEDKPQAPLAQPPRVEERAPLPSLYSAHADAGLVPALKPATRLAPLPLDGQVSYPVFVAASRIVGRDDNEVIAEGDAELRKSNTTLSADRITYWKIEDEVEAVGGVRLSRDADFMTGPKLRLNLTENTGFFEQPKYSITRAAQPTKPVAPLAVIAGEVVSDTRGLTTGTGEAERLEFQGENRVRLRNATYSTCTVDPPDWYAQAADLKLDYDREEGEASDAGIVFKGVSLIHTPWLSFSLNNRRKSGLLTPTLGSTTRTGHEVTLPYYWNIAPNMDATIAPRLMTKRGLQWNGEYRYIQENYSGQMRGEWLPNDNVLGKRRSGFSLRHDQNFGSGFAGSLNINGVSDDTYFSDLATRIATTSQSNLLRQGLLTYGGGWWSATANMQRFQTLQDPSLPPVVKPYERTPQLSLAASRPSLPGGTAFTFNGEFVNFDHPTLDTGRRYTLYPQVSLPWQTPAYFVTPKIGYHMTRYDLTRRTTTGPEAIARNLPVLSVDAGLTFERDAVWEGRALTQTLEPRLYYLLVPKRSQDQIPVFDSGLTDFNFATIFSENVFAGGDRIADANQITVALTSRLIEPAGGQEYLRGLIGQRYFLASQDVTLPGMAPRGAGASDFLAALSGRVTEKIYADAAWQYNPRDRNTERFALGGRWQADFAKVLNVSYRFLRDPVADPAVPGVRQIDLSGQWPLGRGWYGVGRYNYSLRESRLVEAVGGLEYNGGCWLARVVLQRFATTTGTANTSVFVQLELNGFSSIGSKPVELLKRNIPGYGQINQPSADPAFGAN